MILAKLFKTGRRKSRLFRPIQGNGFDGGHLERRSLASASFTRNFNTFSASLETGSESQAVAVDNKYGKDFGGGQADSFDAQYQQAAASNSSASAPITDDNGDAIATVNESGNVTTTVDGPGTGAMTDPNPASSAEIQVSVTHTAKDQFINNNGAPFSPGQGGEQTTEADSGSNNGNYAYSVQGAPAGGSTATITFQASLSASAGANPQLFQTYAYFGVTSTWMNVSLSNRGGISAVSNVAGVQVTTTGDKNFNTGYPRNKTFTATETVPKIPNGTAFNLSFSSQLATGSLGDATFPVGSSTNTSTLNWSFTVKIS